MLAANTGQFCQNFSFATRTRAGLAFQSPQKRLRPLGNSALRLLVEAAEKLACRPLEDRFICKRGFQAWGTLEMLVARNERPARTPKKKSDFILR